MSTVTRRRFLGAGVATAAMAAAPSLIACGDDDDAATSTGTTAASATTAAASASASGTASATSSAPRGPASGTITLAVDTLSDESLDIARFSAGQQLNQMLLTNDTLVRRDMDGKFVPALATSWTSDASGWTFKLNPAARFHDGSPVTADDIAFMVERMLMTENKNFLAGDIRAVLSSVDAVDANTVRFNTKSAFPLMLTVAWGIAPQSRAYFAAKGNDAATNTAYLGSGPFKMTAYSQGQSISFEAIDNFYDVARRPRVKNVTFKIIPDAGTRSAALDAGEVDVALLTPVTAKKIGTGGDLRVVEARATGGSHIVVHDMVYSGDSPLKDLRVRQALVMAMDRDAIVKTVLGGYGETNATPFFPNLLGYDKNLKPHAFDPKAAKALLSAAGAENLSFTYNSFGAGTTPADEFPAIAAYWQQIGLKVDIKQYETLAYLDALKNRTLRGVGHMSYSSAVGGIDGVKLWTSYVACDQQYSNTCLPDMDKVRDVAASELDNAKREAALKQMNQYIYDQLPVVPRWFTSSLVGVGKKVKRLDFPTGWVYLSGLPLETAEVSA